MLSRVGESATLRRQRGASTLVVVLLAVVFLLLASGAAVATLYFTGVIGGGTVGEVLEAGEEAPAPPAGPPRYLPIEPAMVVNFDRNGRVGYLQVNIEIMAREESAIEGVRQHMPVVRNNLLLHMGGKSYEELQTREQKEMLREEARDEINRVLEERGVAERIEEVYFTAFVMQ